MTDQQNIGHGPWNFVANSWQYTTIYDTSGKPLARLDLEDWGVTEENQDDLEKKQAAIARLMAAAPRLYEAIRYSDDAHWTPAMRAVMATVEGRE